MTIENQGEKLFGVKRGVSKVLSNNADVPFIDRINNYQDYPMPASNKDGTVSTHLLSAEIDDDGIAWVFPNKVLDKTNNTYTTYDDNFEAMAVAKASGNAVRFNTIQEAELFSKSYKNDDFNKYYNPSEKERGKTFEGSGANIVDTAKQAYKSTLNVIEESPIPLFGKDSLGTDTLGKIADAVPLVKSVLSPEDSVEKRREEIENLSQSISDRTPDNLTLTQQGFRAALESAPLTAVAMVASIFGTPATGLSIMGGYTGALEYNEAREKGKTFAQSLTYGTVQGSIEAFTERLGLKPLMRMFKNKGDGFMQDAVAYGTRELIGENAAEFGQSMTAWYAGLDEALMNPDLSKTDKLILQAQRQYVASVAALSMSGTTTATTASVKELASQLEDNNAPKRSEGWVKTRATYTRKDKDGNVIEKETGADVYTRIVHVNGKVVPPEQAERIRSVKQDTSERAPANQYGIYSVLQEALMNMRINKNDPQDVINYLINQSVTKDEMKDTGIFDLLQKHIKNNEPVTRENLMNQFYTGSVLNTMDKITLSTSQNSFSLTPESDLRDNVNYGRRLPDDANGRPLTDEEKAKEAIKNGVQIYEDVVNEIISDVIQFLDAGISLPNKITHELPHLFLEDNHPFHYYLTKTGSKYSQTEIVDAIYDATKKANKELIDEIQREADDLGTSNIGASRVPIRGYTPSEKVEFVEQHLEMSYIKALDKASAKFSLVRLNNNPEFIWTVTADTRDGDTERYTIKGNNDIGYYITVKLVDEEGNVSNLPIDSEYESSLNEVEAYIKSRDGTTVEEETKFASKEMVSDGGSDLMPWKTYKETLIVMDSPQKGIIFEGGYPNAHWNVDNIALHLRTTEREDSNKDKVLFIEELQSDWLEAGERRGWRKSDDLKKAINLLNSTIRSNEKTADEVISKFRDNLQKEFPRAHESYNLKNKNGVSFNDFLSPFKALGYSGEINWLTKVMEYKDADIFDLTQEFADSGFGAGSNNPLGNFLEFFKAVKRESYSAIYDAKEKVAATARIDDKVGPTDVKYDNDYWQNFLSSKDLNKIEERERTVQKLKKNVTRLESGVPTAPMKNDTWHELGMKVAIQMAIEGGYKKIAWTNSQEQVRRWKKGPTEIEKWDEATGDYKTVQVPEGVNKRMFINLYDNKMTGFAKRLANQYNSKTGLTIIDLSKMWSLEEHQRLEADPQIKDFQKNPYLEISPEMVEAFKSGRVKFYRRGGLVSKANPEWLDKAGRSIAQSMRNKKWAEYLLELERQKDKKISPGWQGYRRRYAEGGEVTNPIDGLRDYILSEIDGMKFNFAGKLAKGSIIKAVNKSFADLGTNPSREQVEKLWLEQSANLDNLSKILKNPENQEGIKQRITDTYNKAYDSQFNLDIPTTEATKLAETGAVASGGGVLRPLLSSGTQRLAPLLSAVVPGTAQAPTTTEMYGVEFGTPEYYSAGVSFGDSLLSNKKDRREDRVNRTSKIEELKAKNAQAVAEAKARDEQKEEVSVPSSGPSTRGTRAGRTRPSSPPPRVSSGPPRRSSRRGRKRPTRRLTPGR